MLVSFDLWELVQKYVREVIENTFYSAHDQFAYRSYFVAGNSDGERTVRNGQNEESFVSSLTKSMQLAWPISTKAHGGDNEV